ncbi:uncharacterized protein LOC107820012 [Nicotiana tabacum]|uniref:Uncharacterized protein LOC107820012 n=7 Tax=Nicotiana tabacum TaxID=4097 RepID=A0AC58TV04_TOBAC
MRCSKRVPLGAYSKFSSMSKVHICGSLILENLNFIPPLPPPLLFDYLLSGVSFSFSSEVDMQKLESKREISRCEKGMAIEIPVSALYEGSPSDQQCDQCSCSLHWSF